MAKNTAKNTRKNRERDIREQILDPRVRNLGAVGVALVAAARKSQ